MKTTILTIAFAALMAGTISASYGQTPEKDAPVASSNVQEVQKDGNSEFQKFKKESEVRIKSIDNIIGDLKVYFYQNKIKDKEAFQNNLNLLEKKNDDLSAKLTGYSTKDQNEWVSFKPEFNLVIVELAKSLKDFVNKNK